MVVDLRRGGEFDHAVVRWILATSQLAVNSLSFFFVSRTSDVSVAANRMEPSSGALGSNTKGQGNTNKKRFQLVVDTRDSSTNMHDSLEWETNLLENIR